MKASVAEVALSLGVLALGIGAGITTAMLPGEGGYAKIGPNFMPAIVACGLVACGLWLLLEALRGGWRERPPDDAALRGEHPYHAPGFLWITGGLAAQMALIGHAGFVVAGAVLFAAVARGFGSRRWLRDAARGLVMATLVFLFFVRVLNVSLPAGWLRPLLGAAGV